MGALSHGAPTSSCRARRRRNQANERVGAMIVKVYLAGDDDWEVWVGLDDGSDPLDAVAGFCIGQGRTRLDAVREAKKDLRAAFSELEEFEA